jgi:hypothetical protein
VQHPSANNYLNMPPAPQWGVTHPLQKVVFLLQSHLQNSVSRSTSCVPGESLANDHGTPVSLAGRTELMRSFSGVGRKVQNTGRNISHKASYSLLKITFGINSSWHSFPVVSQARACLAQDRQKTLSWDSTLGNLLPLQGWCGDLSRSAPPVPWPSQSWPPDFPRKMPQQEREWLI